MSFDCIVVGAGLAGLSAVRELEKSGRSVILLEASDSVGGRVRSDYIDGFICDRGFQVINPKYPEVAKSGVLKDLDFKYFSGQIRLADYQRKVGYSLSTFSSQFGSVGEKLKLLRFVANPKVSNLRSFGDYTTSFPTLYERVLKPFLTGVFLSDPKNIAGDVAQEILRSFVKSLPGIPAGGVGQFSQRLAASVKNLKLNERVEMITKGKVVTTAGQYNAKYIVVATDPTTAAQLVTGSALPKMFESTTAYFATSDLPMDGKNLVISSNSKLVNSIVISQVSAKYAPVGQHLISATSLSPITESVFRKELSSIWQMNTQQWQYVANYEIKQSLPAHLPGQSKSRNLQLAEGVYVAGDHMATPSQQGAMKSGYLAARAINQLMR
ncbi:protoporphyrinogen oxidase [Candidatus Nanopelagicus limnes]|jgi:protoporphyrinogen oxidase|uniref:Protoporphyrinogen oxidase n=1 Tax=Candidatus Nanopelagicus limnae TaxID=1884634 RepID=A0A249JXK1_9ACTN|nr:NAD(P)/FAD-dependent oxidoreductase [Candidatus Nanopelagicus limnes]ASY09258.1 protoporphyrinogen oxidase [Candidatus Nanopelagicus limnes]